MLVKHIEHFLKITTLIFAVLIIVKSKRKTIYNQNHFINMQHTNETMDQQFKALNEIISVHRHPNKRHMPTVKVK